MDEFDFETTRPSGPLTWQVVAAIGAATVEGVLEEVAGFFGGLSMAFAGAHNHEVDRRQMHEQAALEIEMLTKGIE